MPPITVEVNVVFPLAHIFCEPDRTPADGAAVTVTILAAVTSEQPPVPVIV